MAAALQRAVLFMPEGGAVSDSEVKMLRHYLGGFSLQNDGYITDG